jgi:hypothetical protein
MNFYCRKFKIRLQLFQPSFRQQEVKNMKYTIKQATFEDCAEIARIHVQSWQQTYVGLVPQDYLDGMSIPAR